MIELAELRIFLAVAEERSFSRAALRLHMSQSAVSQNIQALEKGFGVELFVRHGRSIWLSEAGQALLPFAREVINSSRLMEEAMNNIQSQIVGELSLGCSATIGQYAFPHLMALYRNEYPAVKVSIHTFSRSEVVSRLLDERISMGLVSKRIELPHIEHQPFVEDRVTLIVPPHHPWALYGRALPADLLDQPLIIREAESGTTEMLIEALAAYGINREMLNIVLEMSNSEAIELAVEEGIGIAFVSELSAARGLALGKIKKIDVEGLDLRRMTFIARNVQHPLTRAEDRFWSFAQEHRSQLAQQVWDKISCQTNRPT